MSYDVSFDRGLSADRTALAWTRSALNIAATGVLIARGAFDARLPVLGVICAVAIATAGLRVWHHGQGTYLRRRGGGPAANQAAALMWLTALAVATAAVAAVVTAVG